MHALQDIPCGIRPGHRVTFCASRPRWWNLVGWWRWLRRPKGGAYRITGVTRTTMTIDP